MAGDWIVFEHATLGKPEIGQIADRLGITKGDALLALLRVWVWADQQSRDGHVASVTKAHLDDEARVTGFADAMESAGWLMASDSGVEFPNFGRLNGQTSKARALARLRKQRQRAGMSRNCHDESVTKTGPEKRREENKKKKKEGAVGDAVAWEAETGWQNVTERHRADWSSAFPAVNIDRCLAEMHAWLTANPAKAHKSNWARFVVNWLKREQDKGGDAPRRRTTPSGTLTVAERLAMEAGGNHVAE